MDPSIHFFKIYFDLVHDFAVFKASVYTRLIDGAYVLFKPLRSIYL